MESDSRDLFRLEYFIYLCTLHGFVYPQISHKRRKMRQNLPIPLLIDDLRNCALLALPSRISHFLSSLTLPTMVCCSFSVLPSVRR